jgi:predicted ATPase
MYLRSVEIRNYLSLEHVTLEGLGQFNSFIGRNNTGKSAIFGALSFLATVLSGRDIGRKQGEELALVTAQDPDRALGITLTFELRPSDRAGFVDLLPLNPHEELRPLILQTGLLREAEFTFRSPPAAPQFLHLRTTRVRDQDGQWATIQRMMQHDNERFANPRSRMTAIGPIASRATRETTHVRMDSLDLDRGAEGRDLDVPLNLLARQPDPKDRSQFWLQQRLARHLEDCFFFHPFRHSERRPASQEMNRLTQDGSNLVQVLNTVLGADRERFAEVERFVHAAVPDVGTLQTPPRGAATEAGFLAPRGRHFIHLHDMGSGLEQLLMVAVVLLTTAETSTLFLEEPESHLHPGAQRYLLEKLVGGERQVFITTHSPVLVNAGRSRAVYQVTYADRQTRVTRVEDADGLSVLLEDIGARNSDVLLSNAVLFVEGPGDRGALQAWSETLGASLEEHNVTVLPMGGGEYAERSAPVRSDVLAGISRKAPIPHQFVLDRDERGRDEVERLQRLLGRRCHILQARELENYLLVPRALRAAITEKCKADAAIRDRAGQTSDVEVERYICEKADSLYGLVLLKRIRAELSGLRGGLLPRELLAELMPLARDPELGKVLPDRLRRRVTEHLQQLNVDAVIQTQRAELDREWAEPEARLRIVPGEELVSAIFEWFGTRYNKPQDTGRIARVMDRAEIAPEVAEIIRSAVSLAAPRS